MYVHSQQEYPEYAKAQELIGFILTYSRLRTKSLDIRNSLKLYPFEPYWK